LKGKIMSKFNAVKEGTRTTNLAGGVGYTEQAELELASLLMTTLLTDKYYEKEGDILKRLDKMSKQFLTTKEGIEFLAKASYYTRDKFKLRSISHYCSALLGRAIVTDKIPNDLKPLLKRYFEKVVMRGDDVTEIISAYSSINGAYRNSKGRVQLPRVMKIGLSNAIGNFDEYSVAKYKQSSKQTNLIDACRMTHAKHTPKNDEALNKLMEKGTVASTNTWQSIQSKAGKAENKEQAKVDGWQEFLDKDRVEYFALLRNLRNITNTQADDLVTKACEILCDKDHIKRSRVLPFRFFTAYQLFSSMGNNEIKAKHQKQVLSAISTAMSLSIDNAPEFTGSTALLVDVSGSMTNRVSRGASVADIASVFASALYKKNPDTDIILFNEDAMRITPNPEDSIMTIAKTIDSYVGGGTDISSAFDILDRKYDRIIVLSDMQSWLDTCHLFGRENTLKKAYSRYKQKYRNQNPKLFSFDLQGYGTLLFPQDSVYCLAGFSDYVFDLMANLEVDRNFLINDIKRVQI
jgi:hypothetical protein